MVKFLGRNKKTQNNLEARTPKAIKRKNWFEKNGTVLTLKRGVQNMIDKVKKIPKMKKDEKKTAKVFAKEDKRKSKVQIYECIFPKAECKKRFHQDLNAYRDHLITFHLKQELENCLQKQQSESDNDDQMCPVVSCGYFGPFRYKLNFSTNFDCCKNKI